jgi:hypothetical protein
MRYEKVLTFLQAPASSRHRVICTKRGDAIHASALMPYA